MKYGILGGTFNPIHNGHINIGLKIYETLKLHKVFFMPNKIPPHKNSENILDEKIRLHMIKEAIKPYEFFSIEKCELERNEISYTFESLTYLKTLYKNHKLFFIIGSDSFLNFDKWKNIEIIFKYSNLVVYLRKDCDKTKILHIKKNYEKVYNCNIYLIFDDIINISSTEIRNKVINEESIENLVPKSVYEYITLKNLYKG